MKYLKLIVLTLVFFLPRPLQAKDLVHTTEFQVKWIHKAAKEIEANGTASVPNRPYARQWDVDGNFHIDAEEIVPMLEFAEDWRIHKLQMVVDTIDQGEEKAHITRKRFLRQWDTNRDWYIDVSEIEPVREELARALRAKKENNTRV